MSGTYRCLGFVRDHCESSTWNEGEECVACVRPEGCDLDAFSPEVLQYITEPGLKPFNLAVLESQNKLFVSDWGSKKVLVFHGETLAKLDEIDVGGSPGGLYIARKVYDPVNGLVYSNAEINRDILVVDDGNRTCRLLALGAAPTSTVSCCRPTMSSTLSLRRTAPGISLLFCSMANSFRPQNRRCACSGPRTTGAIDQQRARIFIAGSSSEAGTGPSSFSKTSIDADSVGACLDGRGRAPGDPAPSNRHPHVKPGGAISRGVCGAPTPSNGTSPRPLPTDVYAAM